MLKLTLLSLSLFSSLSFANNVFIYSDNVSGSIPVGTAMNKISSESLVLDVPSGLKVMAYSGINFNGEVSQYKEGEHSNLNMQSFKVEADVNPSFSMIFNEYNPDPSYCVDIKYSNKDYELITAATVCSGETKEIFTSIPDGFSAGESILFGIYKDDKFLLMGNLAIRANGEIVLNGRPNTGGGVRAYAQTPSLLNLNYYRR
ncbi:hypothetical protein [Photobacterium leiognathi]|uniref:hypothetical protein n=1 Tax=Photobacterium leiognathi TaxID=553611 RepID=UPI002980F2E6|nr:hypothetical protein [Photobacterium leiognathi]